MEDATVVILAGGRDFGRCPIATRLPRALWPLVGRPVLDYQLHWIARQGIQRAVVCSSGDKAIDQYGIDLASPPGMSVAYEVDRMPRGAAGCLKDAVADTPGGTVVAIEAGVVWLRDIKELLRRHRQSGCAMTVFASGGGDSLDMDAAGVYICERYALDQVLDRGYQDIKEQMIPALLRKRLVVRAAAVPESFVAGRGLDGYLALAGLALSEPGEFGLELGSFRRQGNFLVGPGARVEQSARATGPVIVMHGAAVGREALLAGPVIVGREARLGAKAVVDESVIWDGAVIGEGACVTASVVDEGAMVPDETYVSRAAFSSGGRGPSTAPDDYRYEGTDLGKEDRSMRRSEPAWSAGSQPALQTTVAGAATWVIGIAATVAALFWAYWDVLADLANVWRRNDDYSSGFLVPFLALYVVYSKRKSLSLIPASPSFSGIALILCGFVVRLAARLLLSGALERLSLIVVVSGIVLTVFGMALTWRLKWVLLFLVLMMPLPNRVHQAVSLPLQNWATTSAVFALETLGWIVEREGNILHLGLGGTTVAVEEACSGLRMLTAFMIVSALVALLANRIWWQKTIIVVSSVPIAVFCNTIRLTATAIAFDADYGPQVNQWFHDFGGLAMMPLALLILAGEMWLFSKIYKPAEADAGTSLA